MNVFFNRPDSSAVYLELIFEISLDSLFCKNGRSDVGVDLLEKEEAKSMCVFSVNCIDERYPQL